MFLNQRFGILKRYAGAAAATDRYQVHAGFLPGAFYAFGDGTGERRVAPPGRESDPVAPLQWHPDAAAESIAPQSLHQSFRFERSQQARSGGFVQGCPYRQISQAEHFTVVPESLKNLASTLDGLNKVR